MAEKLALKAAKNPVTGVKYTGKFGGHNTSERRSQMRARLASAFWEMGRDSKVIPLRLTCRLSHRWVSQIDPKSEDRAGVIDPKCPICNQFFFEYVIVRAVLDESVECGKGCWKDKTRKCVCSCGGLNHGTALLSQAEIKIPEEAAS